MPQKPRYPLAPAAPLSAALRARLTKPLDTVAAANARAAFAEIDAARRADHGIRVPAELHDAAAQARRAAVANHRRFARGRGGIPRGGVVVEPSVHIGSVVEHRTPPYDNDYERPDRLGPVRIRLSAKKATGRLDADVYTDGKGCAGRATVAVATVLEPPASGLLQAFAAPSYYASWWASSFMAPASTRGSIAIQIDEYQTNGIHIGMISEQRITIWDVQSWWLNGPSDSDTSSGRGLTAFASVGTNRLYTVTIIARVVADGFGELGPRYGAAHGKIEAQVPWISLILS